MKWNLSPKRTQPDPEVVMMCPTSQQGKLRPWPAPGAHFSSCHTRESWTLFLLHHNMTRARAHLTFHVKGSPNRGKSIIPLGNVAGEGVYFNYRRQTSVKRQIPVQPVVIVFFLWQAPGLDSCCPHGGRYHKRVSPGRAPTSGAGNGPHRKAARLAFVWNNSAPMIPHSCWKYWY